jgi:hypothetical protein
MKPSDKVDFVKHFTVMAKMCGVKNVERARAQGYFNMFQEYPLEQVKKALVLATQANEIANTLPMPAAILKHLKIDIEHQAITALEKLQRAIKCRAAVIVFDDPVLHRTIEIMGGFNEARNELSSNYSRFFIGQFNKTYTKLAEMAQHVIYVHGKYFIADPSLSRHRAGAHLHLCHEQIAYVSDHGIKKKPFKLDVDDELTKLDEWVSGFVGSQIEDKGHKQIENIVPPAKGF